MFAVIYRWKLKDGLEDQFAEGWARVTRAIHAGCGSYGSRLHRATDGSWVAYARWPDAETRDRCEHGDEEGMRMMREAIAEGFEQVQMEIVDDLLQEPR